MRTIWQDLSFGVRILLKKPVFTLVAILTLSLGIGANTAIFSVVNAVLLRPLDYPEPEKIMALWPARGGGSFQGVSEAKYLFWRANAQSFDGLTATTGVGSGINLAGGDEPEFVTGSRVSADFFKVLGVNPVIGRGFTLEEDSPNGDAVVILSNELWRRRFNADPSISGKSVSLNGTSYTVVGVMPEGFRYADRQDLLLPLRLNPASRGEGHNFRVLGRLKSGVAPAQARADMQLVFGKFKEAEPKMLWRQEDGVRVESYLDSMTSTIRPMLWMLFGVVVFVLLIACANVANLQLARAASRSREMAIRAAMGASRGRIARQLLTEGVLLGVLGGAAGLMIASLGVEALAAVMPANMLPRTGQLSFDWRVLGFALATAVGAGLLFTLVPALRAGRVDLNEALKESGGKGASGGERTRIQNVLVVVEVALSLILLIGASLLLRTFINLRQVEPGFDPRNVLTFEVAPNGGPYTTTAGQADYVRRALDRIKALPGVESAAVSTTLPLVGLLNFGVSLAGKPDSVRSTEIRMITPEYFEVLKMNLRHGRAFNDADSAGAAPAIIVNEAYAKRVLPGADPIGKYLSVEGVSTHSIVGVVNDIRHFSLGSPAPPQVFVPLVQIDDKLMRAARQFVTLKVAIRTAQEPLSLSESVRREMLAVDPTLPVVNLRSLEQIVSRSLASDRFNSMLIGSFALIGLILAAVGVYGVISYTTANRTHEIGLRMALGAERGDVLGLIIKQAMVPSLLGVAIGLGGAYGLTRLMKDYLFGVTTTDPLSFAAIAMLLITVALAACWIPARRAAKVDPMIALRGE
jgi:putative ABC transport system permease protein